MSNGRPVALGKLLTRAQRTVKLKDGTAYPAVSVQMFGRGLGVKEPFVGGVSKYTTLNVVRANDVVLRTITAFEAPVGVAHAEHDGTHVSGVFVTYEVTGGVLPAFLELYFQTPTFWDEMRNRSSGTVLRRKTISDSSFREICMRLPALATQDRIVHLVGAIDRQIDALGGEASALLAVLRRRRADLLTDDSVTAVRAEQAFEITMGRQRSPKYASGPHMTPYLRSANVGNGILNLDDVLEMNFDPEEREKFGLVPGDVLVSEGSASHSAVGMSAVWGGELDGTVCFQKTLMRYRAIEGVSTPGFVKHWCSWAYESGTFLDVAGGTNIKHITAMRAVRMPVRLPGVAVQERIAAELDAIDVTLMAIRAEAARLRQVRTGLLSGLLDRTIDIESAGSGI